ncbi:hypothetical protein [Sphingopyxis sp. RIFCSPHIGHO2_12_FULL_65_19]|uniref:hypothetical protein n=1 Tax=Sphingopyxis sp. RIFCSPHIGHO2_12_FULL_65_19 TaxID=1802172 RepID=UPI0008D58495|nr:hypothetical protein [Sphingopyxis sp. RIFCSPHIGHO2_12_FULL_65_19]OHD06150.1 MAG: hypothetical protein A3E77_12445 [Sphingopyxis sp. RIFCSPHIGHO2_12_FULL_65_19]
MKALYLAGGAALLSILACAAPTAAADPLVLSDVSWVAEPAGGKKGAPRVRIQHKQSRSDQALDGSRPYFAAAEAALGQSTPGPVRFTVTHDAGTLACTGTLTRAFEGKGECRFTSDPGFERALGDRGLSPDRRSTLLAMLMVDATIELADGLAKEGVRPKDADDLIAAAALEVSPDYIRDLRSEALVLTDVEDAIACKALGVDGAYVRGLAAAGYRKLSADEVVGMKAMGVTGAYAQAMNRAAGGVSK